MLQEQIIAILSRVPTSTIEYVTALLICPNHRLNKNTKLAQNTILVYGSCSPADAAAVCEWLKLKLASEVNPAELRERWQVAFHDINTKPIGIRSHATGHRLL
jgi:hypothetical protein